MLSLLLLATSANAAPTFFDAGLVLRAPATGDFAGGVNAPTVEYDRFNRQFVMYFESLQTTYPSDCVNSYVIGRATSTNGFTWVIDSVPVLEGDEADSTAIDHCGVNQPAIVFDGTTWHLFYSQAAAKQTSTSTSNEPGGIGYATSTDGENFTIVDDQVIPPSTDRTQPVGLPSVSIKGGEFYLVYDQYPDIHLYTAPVDLSTGWVDEGLVIDNADASFSSTWVFGPSLVCHPVQDWTIFVSGDSSSGRSFAEATSPDAMNWTYDADTPVSTGSVPYSSLNHFDVLRNGAGTAWAIWYSMTDSSTGLKAIGHGATRPRSFRYLSKGCL